MARTIEIRPLSPQDDRSAFRSGEPAIDRFFVHYAGQNQFKLKLAVTYVAVEQEELLGFVTLSVGHLEKREIPSAELRRRLPAYPLPILRVARLGVDQSSQGQGLGRRLLRHAFRVALTQRDAAGCVGVVVDAKPTALSFYDALGFTSLTPVREGALHGDFVPLFLEIRAIAQAMKVA